MKKQAWMCQIHVLINKLFVSLQVYPMRKVQGHHDLHELIVRNHYNSQGRGGQLK